jgi:hypothetical protein
MDSNLDKKFSYVKEDALFSIEISGKYYHELKKVFVSLIMQEETKEKILSRFTLIAQGKVSTPEEHSLHLMYALINEIEETAIKNNMTEDKSTDEVFPEN